MKLWGGESDTGCCSVSDVDDARRVARARGIEHHVFNFGDRFASDVIEPYVAAHASGDTPNPCIECNRHLKFDKLLRRATALGFDAIATGHHARITTGADGTCRITRGADRSKDQSYVLYMLDQEQLRRTLLPVGDMTKADVRAMADSLGLPTATKPDSQDVCFITSKRGRSGFLRDRMTFTHGQVVDAEGRAVGEVDAVQLVTVGQRKGLGLPGGDGDARYAIDVDVARAVVTVGNEGDLLDETTTLRDITWSGREIDGDVFAQCSAHGPALAATFDPSTSTLAWQEPHRRVAAGQAVVLYTEDDVLGGGIAVTRSHAHAPR
jgi:tRNA-specific 2-thiouridylase